MFKGGVFRQAYGTIISLCERKIELLNIGVVNSYVARSLSECDYCV